MQCRFWFNNVCTSNCSRLKFKCCFPLIRCWSATAGGGALHCYRSIIILLCELTMHSIKRTKRSLEQPTLVWMINKTICMCFCIYIYGNYSRTSTANDGRKRNNADYAGCITSYPVTHFFFDNSREQTSQERALTLILNALSSAALPLFISIRIYIYEYAAQHAHESEFATLAMPCRVMPYALDAKSN